MNAAIPRSFLLLVFVLVSACEIDGGPILVPDGGEDAGPEPDGGADAGDQEAPEVVETTPAHGATDVATDTAIVIRFSEAMDESAGTVAIEIDGAAAGAPAASWSEDGTALTLTPAAALDSSARVRVTVRADFEDLGGNPLAAPTAFAFDVADVEAPRATAATPSEGATDVPRRLDAIEIVFSEAMSATGTLTLEGGDGTVGDPVWSTASVRFPVSGLEYDTAYRVVLDGFADAAGNALDGTGYLGDGALDLTTGPDRDGPIVVDSNPDEGQVNVSLRSLGAIVVELDEPMDTSLTQAELAAPGAVRTLTGTWSADGRTITFPLAGELSPNGAHSLDLSALTDAAGNAIDAVAHLYDGRLDFVTGADDVVPAVVFATPGEGTVEATFRDSVVRLVFNQAMDTSITTLPFDDGAGPIDLTGTWNLAGTRLSFDVTDALRSETTYRLDATEMRDATGRPVDVSHSYLGDGVLDFTTIAGNGESCRDALTVPTSTTATGGLVFEIGERQVIDDDGSMSCDTAIPADAVIRYRKTSAEGGTAGGRWLLVRASDSVGGVGRSVRVNVEIFAASCDPVGAGSGAARRTCLTGAPAWDSYLAAPAGDYFIWVSHEDGATFRPITVVVEEIDAPPHGESCTDPLTTSSPGFYTPPAGPSDPHVWDLPAGAFTAHDIGPVTGGPGTITCDEDGVHGVDAVIRFDKAASDSVLDVRIEAYETSLPGLSFELLDRCDGTSPEAASLACTTELRRLSSTGPPNARRSWMRAPAGPVFAWVASGSTYGASPRSRVSIREVPASPGIDCSNAIPITPGSTVPVTPVTERLFPPSCAPATANLTWYRVAATERALLVTGTTADPAVDGAVAIIDPVTDAELSCTADIEQTFESAFVDVGEERCIAVESGSVTSLTVEAIPYDGLAGTLTDLLIDRPLNAAGTGERGISTSQWMQVTPTTAYLGVGTGTSVMSVGNFLAFASRTGGFRADVNDAYQGPVNGYSAAAVGEAIFVVDDLGTAGTTARLNRIIDSLGTYGSVAWDMGTSYPGYPIRAMAYDGTDLWLVSHATTASHVTRVWRASPTAPGPLVHVGDIPGIERVLGITIDGTYMYLAASAGGSAGVFRVPHAGIDPTTTPAPERIATLALPTTLKADIVLDDPLTSGNLYVRGTAGVHVISRPASAAPRHLGLLVAVNGSGRPMARDPVSGSLYLIQIAGSDQIFVRVD